MQMQQQRIKPLLGSVGQHRSHGHEANSAQDIEELAQSHAWQVSKLGLKFQYLANFFLSFIVFLITKW